MNDVLVLVVSSRTITEEQMFLQGNERRTAQRFDGKAAGFISTSFLGLFDN